MTEIKIDKSFVLSMAGDAAASAVVRAVGELAHSLDLRIVAEGVEDQRTLDALTAIGADLHQGYYLSRPLPAVELTEWLTTRVASTQGTPNLHAVRTTA